MIRDPELIKKLAIKVLFHYGPNDDDKFNVYVVGIRPFSRS